MLPPLKIEHTLSQKFEIQKIQNVIHQIPREELEKFCISLIEQKYSIQNAFNNLLKNSQ